MADYKKSVGVQGGLYALGEFPIAHAEAIEVSKDKRLDQKLNDLDDRVTDIGHTTQIVEDALEGLVGDTGLVKNYVDESVSQAMAHTDEAVANINVSYPIVNNPADITIVDETYYSLEPETYYVFGEVDALPVYCDDPNDGLIHEFAFEFVPSENFTAIEFGSAAPIWATPVQFPIGRVCQVSIMRGVGVMISA